MQNTKKPVDLYTEQEAADFLGVSVDRLRKMLDEHIFNDGSTRPPELTFTNSELILLGFWQRTEPANNVVRMPRRN